MSILEQQVWEHGDGKSQLRSIFELVLFVDDMHLNQPLTRLEALTQILGRLVELNGQSSRFNPGDVEKLLRATFARDRDAEDFGVVYPEDRCSMDLKKDIFVNVPDWSSREKEEFVRAIETLGQLGGGYTKMVGKIADEYLATFEK